MSRKSIRECEICKCAIDGIRHKHHIIPRTDARTTNHSSNLAYICPNCHAKVHLGSIILEGVFLSTAGLKLFWHHKDDPYIVRPGVFLNKDGTATIIEE